MTKIPEGLSSITPFISFENPSEAIEFYKKSLGAEVIVSLPAPNGDIMYAELQIGSSRIMVGKSGEECSGNSIEHYGGSPVSFYIYVDNVEASFSKAKSAGMTDKQEITDMFWGDRMGTLKDQYNMVWSIAEHVREVSPEEMQEAMEKMAS